MSLGRQRFSIIPAVAVTDRRLDPRDLQVLCLLGRHTDNRGWCCRSQVKMARELGCGRSTLQRSISRLAEAGYVERRANQRESGADAAHDYRVVIDPVETSTTVTEEASEGVPTGGQGVPAGGQGCPPMDGHGVPAHGWAPMLTVPSKRSERARARTEGPTIAGTAARAAFEKAFRAWPTAVADSAEDALSAWLKLSQEDQQAAAGEARRYVSVVKSFNRTLLCSFATYLRERRWLGLAEKPQAQARPDEPEQAPVKTMPTAFQRANPHLYPELFGGSEPADLKESRSG